MPLPNFDEKLKQMRHVPFAFLMPFLFSSPAFAYDAPAGFEDMATVNTGPLASLIRLAENICAAIEGGLHDLPLLGAVSPGLAIIIWAFIVKVV